MINKTYILALFLLQIVLFGDLCFSLDKSAVEMHDATFHDGLNHAYKKSYSEAIKLFEQNIKDYPESKKLDYDYGWAMKSYAFLGQYDKALQYCEILCSKYYGWIENSGTKRSWGDAVLEVKKTIENDPDLQNERKASLLKKINDYVNIAIQNTPPKNYPDFSEFRNMDNENRIEFGAFVEPFNEIDWDSLVPKWVKSINKKSPNPELLDKLKTNKYTPGGCRINYDAAVPEQIAKYSYYLISDEGAEKLLLKNIQGAIGCQLNNTDSAISQIYIQGTMGSIIATLPEKFVVGGFVMQMDKDSEISVSSFTGKDRFHVRLSKNVITYTYRTMGGNELVLTKPAAHQVGITVGYSFRVNGKEFVFVQWEPDQKCAYGCCNYDYTLFKTDPGLEELKRESFGCDI